MFDDTRPHKRNFSRPTAPSTATATTIADTTSINVSYTAATVGPTATSFLVTGTSTTGVTVSTSITTSPTTVTGFSGGATYNVTIAGQNYNGLGTTLTAGTGLSIPLVYGLQATYNTSGTYTVASGITKIAAYIISGGGGGGGGSAHESFYPSGGGGGGGAGIVGFKDFSVTAGQTVTITVGAAGVKGNAIGSNSGWRPGNSGGTGGISKITYGGVDIGTSNGGSGGNTSVNNSLENGAGGAGGTGSSNVAGAITITGPQGGRPGNYYNSQNSLSGSTQSSNSNLSAGNNVTAIVPSNTKYGSGGGGGSFNGPQSGAGGGGAGGAPGSAATGVGAGGGGGNAFQGNAAQDGGAGAAGEIILYIA